MIILHREGSSSSGEKIGHGKWEREVKLKSGEMERHREVERENENLAMKRVVVVEVVVDTVFPSETRWR